MFKKQRKMAWNGSDNKDNAGDPRQKRKLNHLSSATSSSFNYKALVAGVSVAILVGLVAWLMHGWEKTQIEPKVRKPTRIVEVAPKPAPRPFTPVPAKPKYDRPQIAGEIRDGYRLLPNGKLHKVTGVYTSNVERLRAPGKGIDHPVNQAIVDLLRATPGEYILGDSKDYFSWFSEDFAQTEDSEIQIRPDDSEETKELKAALIETRKELKARQANGEDLTKVMREAREQLRELHLYREELAEEVKKIANDTDKELSEKDIHDLVDAANTMLEERGSMPLQLTAPLLYQLREEKIDREIENQ